MPGPTRRRDGWRLPLVVVDPGRLMTTTTHRSICRFCHAGCPIMVDDQGGRPKRMRGDLDDLLYRGFSSQKGRQLPTQHAHPDRLLSSMRRNADGPHDPIVSEDAITEIAEQVTAIV